MYTDMRVVTKILLQHVPDDPDLLWDFAFARDPECQLSIVSEPLFNRILVIGNAGFDCRPGDFPSMKRVNFITNDSHEIRGQSGRPGDFTLMERVNITTGDSHETQRQ